MAHRADGLNDIYDNNLDVKKRLTTTEGTIHETPVNNSDIANKAYVDGVASGFTDPMTTRGDVIYKDASNDTTRLGVGGVGTFLGSNGTDVAWDTPTGSGDVSAAANLTDEIITIGDGGAKGIKSSAYNATALADHPHQDVQTTASPTFVKVIAPAGEFDTIATDTDGDITFNNDCIFTNRTGHDTFLDYVADEHIDWTNSTDNFSTTGTIHSNGNITTNGSVDGIDIAGMSGYVTLNSGHRNDTSGADHSSLVTAVGLNTAKDTNVSTDLSAGTRAPTTIDVNSSDGSNATLVEADTTNAGILGSDKWNEIVANTLKDTDVDHNVTTNITVVEAPTNVDIQSSDGSNDTIAAANVTNAGVMTTTMYDNHILNNAKNTNVSTNLSMGTVDGTQYNINSSDGNNVALPLATTDNWGIISDEMFDQLAAAVTHYGDNTQAHSDYLLNSGADVAVGPLTTTADNSTADQAYVAMVLYNTDDTPPAASGFPVGTIYLQYTN